MNGFGTVSGKIRKAFPNLSEWHIGKLARLIVTSCDNYEEALDVASEIPRQTFGTFRFNAKSKDWIVFCDTRGNPIDH